MSNTNLRYADYVYHIVEHECEGLDSIYADYIKQLVGEYGLNALLIDKRLESCGVMNGRQLYVLCEKKGDKG